MANWRACGRTGLAAVVTAAVLAGCSADPSTVPTPAPSAASETPTVSATPTESSMERKQREDFEAAERAYRTFMAENNRLLLRGGSTKPSAVMRKVSTGPWLEFYADSLAYQKRMGLRHTAPTLVEYVRRDEYAAEQVTLEICEDSTKSRTFDRRGAAKGSGVALKRIVFVKREGRAWKVWNASELGQVKKCVELS